jgi:hypothetical protein
MPQGIARIAHSVHRETLPRQRFRDPFGDQQLVFDQQNAERFVRFQSHVGRIHLSVFSLQFGRRTPAGGKRFNLTKILGAAWFARS